MCFLQVSTGMSIYSLAKEIYMGVVIACRQRTQLCFSLIHAGLKIALEKHFKILTEISQIKLLQTPTDKCAALQ